MTWVDGGDDEEDGSEISSLGGSGAFNGNRVQKEQTWCKGKNNDLGVLV